MTQTETNSIGTMKRLRRCEEALTVLWNDVDRVRANLESRSRLAGEANLPEASDALYRYAKNLSLALSKCTALLTPMTKPKQEGV